MKTIASVLLFVFAAAAQEDATRQLWNTEFQKKRPAGSGTARPAQVKYKPVAASAPGVTAPAGQATMLGVTLWRMRDPKPSDAAGTRLLVLEKGGTREQVPERISAATPLGAGDRVHLTVEVPASGYLYIIDRERYSDGTLSGPYLIYPNGLTGRGDNVVAPGRLLEIPDRRDDPNTFVIRPSRPDQTAEVLFLLVSPQPIPGIKIVKVGEQPWQVPAEMYASWEKQWSVKADCMEMEEGGVTVTAKENKAGADKKMQLTQDDPLPQTLYRVDARPGHPMMVEIPLKLKK
jgi:hypothetical protein